MRLCLNYTENSGKQIFKIEKKWLCKTVLLMWNTMKKRTSFNWSLGLLKITLVPQAIW